MSDEAPLNPQEPGAQDQAADPIADLAALTVPQIVGELDALTTEQLAQLYGIEKGGRGRKSVLAAIEAAQEGRDDAAPPEARVPNVTGDPQSYARMRASEIDQATLAGPVLTLDGWLLPRPKAQAE